MRKESGEVVAGRNPVMEALKAGRVYQLYLSDTIQLDKVVRGLIEQARAAGVVPQTVQPARLDNLAGTNHQGVVALCEQRAPYTLDELLEIAKGRNEDPFILLLDGVEDPHNLGAVLRVADCVGAHGVVVPGRGAAGLTPTVFKSSAGAAEHVPLVEVGSITDAVNHLRRANVWVGYAEANAGKAHWDERLTGPLAIVMGSEGAGVSKPVMKQADFAIHIPLRGSVNSLNVSVATAVVAFERARQLAAKRK